MKGKKKTKEMQLSLKNIIKSLIEENVDQDTVLDAIRNRYYVRIRYDDGQNNISGNAKGSRLIQPMAIGTTKKGYPVVRAFQLNGNSRRGAPNWKFFRLDRIVNWRPMPNKHFNAPPDESFGRYNRNGDLTMGTFFDNAKLNDFTSPLEREREKRSVPKMSSKNAQGPISADKQWKRNVYTSQPNSSKYAAYAKNIDATKDDADRFDNDLWAAAERERDMQNRNKENPQGPINTSNNQDSYDISDVDFNENDFFNNKK
jgi:hypothetical protein